MLFKILFDISDEMQDTNSAVRYLLDSIPRGEFKRCLGISKRNHSLRHIFIIL